MSVLSTTALAAALALSGTCGRPQPDRSHASGNEPSAGQQERAAPALARVRQDPPPRGAPWPPNLPFAPPPIPDYRVPNLEDCDWIIEGGRATSLRDLPTIEGLPHLLGKIYAAHVAAALPLPCTVGVRDDAGSGVVAGGWNVNSDLAIVAEAPGGGYADIEIEIVGLSDACEVSLGWDAKWGRAKYVGLFDIGLRGQQDSFIIRANSGIGTLIVDGCWWLQSKSFSGNQRHTSGMHIDRWETLVWRNHRFRGELPSDPGTLLREHSAYLKSCVADGPGEGTWIVGNDLRGGNRTGFQLRPQQGLNPFPSGPVVVAYNHASGYGFTHGRDRATADGGSCITVWSAPNDDVYVFGNAIVDARYGCLTISGQGPDRNFDNEDGYPIRSVHVFGNTFENLAGDRAAASISSTQNVLLYGRNTFLGANGDLVLDAVWAMKVLGLANGSVSVMSADALEELRAVDIRTWNPKHDERMRALDADLLASWLVDPED